jgi:hypothetical protein
MAWYVWFAEYFSTEKLLLNSDQETQTRTSTAFEDETPPLGPLCYLLIEEVRDHLQATD